MSSHQTNKRILQWNVRGIRANAAELTILLSFFVPLVVALQETKLSPDTNYSVKYYTTYRRDVRHHSVAHGGVALLVHHSIPCKKVSLQTCLQAVAVTIDLGVIKPTICSMYLPPGTSPNLDDFESVLDQLPPPFMILGDLNAHNAAWGGSYNSSRGRSLERILNRNNLCFLNSGQPTHISLPSGNTSVIDLSICTPSLLNIFSWKVEDTPHGSDHFPILLEMRHARLGTRPPRWDFRRADWPKFTSGCELDIESCPTDSASSLVEHINTSIITAAKASIPMTSARPRRIPVPWWTEECKNAILRKKRAFRQFQRSSTSANLILFKKARAQARRATREAKRASWRTYVSGINRFTPLTQVWQRIQRISGKYQPTPTPVLTFGDNTITDPKEVADKIGHALVARSEQGSNNPRFVRLKENSERRPVDFSCERDETYNAVFSKDELMAALNNTRDVSPGPDLITNNMLRNLRPESLDTLLWALNHIWTTDSFPAQWRESVVVPIRKPNKEGSNPDHYRPISLTSCVCKLFEKMICARLMWFLEHHDILSNAQCGFRKHRPTLDHLLTLDTAIRKAFKERQHLCAVFFDVEKAFETAWHHGMLSKLHDHGIRGHMGWFLTNFLADRRFRVRIGNTLSDTFPLRSGVPQGGVLSVALFAIMINDVASSLNPNTGRSLFVDDVAIWVTSSSSVSASRQLQISTQHISDWGDRNGFTFSTGKTCCVHFCNRRRECNDPTIYLYDKTIPVVNSCKFLGVTMDRRLTYIDHMKALREKCLKAMSVLKVVSRMSYGADRKTMLLLYRALIRSKLDYASQIYDSARESSKKMLDTVHHQGIRICTGAFRTSPTISILAEAYEPPLALRRLLLSLRYAARIKQFPSHPTYRSMFSDDLVRAFSQGAIRGTQPFCLRVHEWLTDAGTDMRRILVPASRQTEPWLARPLQTDESLTRFSKDMTHAEELRQEAQRLISTTYRNSAHFYTDGSKTSHGTGSAYYSVHGTGQTSLPQTATVLTAELYAILSCLERIAELNIANLTIFTDSLSSVRLLSATSLSRSPYRDLVLDRVDELQKAGRTVTLVWIPAHVGIMGNEEADKAAKAAALRAPADTTKVPASDLKGEIKRYMLSKWQRLWDEVPQRNKLKNIKPRLSEWASSYRRSRAEEVTLCRLRIGHAYDTHRHLLLRDLNPPACNRCGEYLSVKHVLVDCPRLQEERERCLKPPFTLKSLIGDPHTCDMEAIMIFLCRTGFKTIYNPASPC